jgi:glycosyltransferase involved in cell wall biosynthesis
MKKVLHLTFDMRIGGTEQVIKNIVQSADPSKYQMSIFCIEEPVGPFGQSLIRSGTPVFSTNRKPGLDLTLIRKIREHVKAHHIDVLHCHQYTPWVYGTLASLGLGAKIIFTEHGRFYPDRTSWKRRLVNPLLARFTHSISAISKATKQALVVYEFIPEKRIQVIYNGIIPIDPQPQELPALRQSLGISDDTVIMGTIARFDSIKIHPMLLNAFKHVTQSVPKTVLLMIGDGDERERTHKLCHELGLDEQVIFTGYIENPQRHLELMDIFLLPSLSEGTSMTLLEAMSLSKPCIVTDVGGNPEIIIDGENGLTTPNDDALRYADAVCELVRSAERRVQMAKAARTRFMRHFTAQTMYNHYQTIYQ